MSRMIFMSRYHEISSEREPFWPYRRQKARRRWPVTFSSRSILMVRILAVGCTLLAFLFLINAGTEGAAQQQKPQMVKGTIKSVDVKKNVLVINQVLKNKDIVDRELSIETTTEF